VKRFQRGSCEQPNRSRGYAKNSIFQSVEKKKKRKQIGTKASARTGKEGVQDSGLGGREEHQSNESGYTITLKRGKKSQKVVKNGGGKKSGEQIKGLGRGNGRWQ